jgi:hypothetical protein
VLGGVDGVGGEDLAGLEVDDGDGGVVGDGQDPVSAVGVADAEVVHAAGAADRDFAPVIDAVVAQPEVTAGVAGGGGFRQRRIGGGRGSSGEFAVGSLLVVDLAKRVELGLSIGEGQGSNPLRPTDAIAVVSPGADPGHPRPAKASLADWLTPRVTAFILHDQDS